MLPSLPAHDSGEGEAPARASRRQRPVRRRAGARRADSPGDHGPRAQAPRFRETSASAPCRGICYPEQQEKPGARTAGLLPRDAIHASVMRRLGITAIASDGDDCERCAGFALYTP